MRKLKQILLLTSLYPASDLPKENTPVVHYFTKEWVKMGYEVAVVHYPYNFPRLITIPLRPFSKYIAKVFGMAVIRTSQLTECEYELDGVKVKRIPLKKYIPHGRYGRNEICRAERKTLQWLKEINFKPDVITGHWANPQVEMMRCLKNTLNVPCSLVLHNAGRDFKTIYRNETESLLSGIDLIGYRSDYIKKEVVREFHLEDKPNFLCRSGIPEEYVNSDAKGRNYNEINSFIYVGTLIKRKYPAQIIPAISKEFGDKDFSLTYIGTGEEENRINIYASKYNVTDKVHILGRLPRMQVVEQLKKSDVLIMISKSETYGLVYLEMMAVGGIAIASRHEGFDGIIRDGYNGFLCEAGNSEELSQIIHRIRRMNKEELKKISQNAIATAQNLTDRNTAMLYVQKLESVFIAHEKT